MPKRKATRIQELVDNNDAETLKAMAEEAGVSTSGNKTELATAIVEAQGAEDGGSGDEEEEAPAGETSGQAGNLSDGQRVAERPTGTPQPDVSKMTREEQAARGRGPDTVDVGAEKAVHSGRAPHQVKLGEDGQPIRDDRTLEERQAAAETEAQKKDN